MALHIISLLDVGISSISLYIHFLTQKKETVMQKAYFKRNNVNKFIIWDNLKKLFIFKLRDCKF